MCSLGLSFHQPIYETILRYATAMCPVKTGQNWTKEEIHTEVMRGPHESALADDAITHFATEEKGKVASNGHFWYYITT